MPRPAIDPARVRELHAAGLIDREAAAVLGCSASWVKVLRTRLGLRGHGQKAPSCRRRAAGQMAGQLAAAGVRSLRQLAPGDPHRRAKAAALARRYGLPPDLYPAQVRVLVALAAGPLTTAELVAAAGRRPRPGAGNAYMSFNAPKLASGLGNYLGDLRRRGLVAFTGREPRRGRGAGRGYRPGLNVLTPAAMDLMAFTRGGAA